MSKKVFFTAILFATLISCKQKQETIATEKEAVSEINPPAKGFNLENSDEQAILIADKVMEAMGGRKNWDETRYIGWNFFGSRKLLWDKKSGNVRIEIPSKQTVLLVNVFNHTGKVKIGEKQLTQPDSIAKYVKQAENIWINDSYWLIMPFKLKDSGVTLKYLREDTVQTGQKAAVLQLTFEEVGKSPDNKYEVFVDKETNLVSQWAFFPTANSDSA
ncbi:MAG: hypothetical protein ACI85I_001475, partial [Arenicella sp.]